jgi:Mg2+ and Co2+ transporter CorA
MAKSEVYSWRLSVETKSALEETARRKQSSIAELLDQIVNDWLAHQQELEADEAEQQRLHEAALQIIGNIRGDDPDRSSNAKTLLRAKLARRREN